MRKLVIYLAALTLIVISTASTAEIKVPADYTTIQEAVDNAAMGDIISVSAGTFKENVVIENKEGLKIVGNTTERGNNTIVDGSKDNSKPVFKIKNSIGIFLTNLDLNFGLNGVLGVEGGDLKGIRLEYLNIKESVSHGIDMQGVTTNLRITYSYINECGGSSLNSNGELEASLDVQFSNFSGNKTGNNIELKGFAKVDFISSNTTNSKEGHGLNYVNQLTTEVELNLTSFFAFNNKGSGIKISGKVNYKAKEVDAINNEGDGITIIGEGSIEMDVGFKLADNAKVGFRAIWTGTYNVSDGVVESNTEGGVYMETDDVGVGIFANTIFKDNPTWSLLFWYKFKDRLSYRSPTDTVMSCTFTGNGDGIRVSAGRSVLISENYLAYNTNGIVLDGSTGSILQGNEVTWNGVGVSLENASSNTLEQNWICYNSTYDISSTSSGNTGLNNTCDYYNNWNDVGVVEGCTSPCIYPKIYILTMTDVFQGQFIHVPIVLSDYELDMGGYDFLIAYDASALNFTAAEPGQLLRDCEWEYFTYRYGADGNCGDACPSGLLRIIAIAEMADGISHPSCFGPPDPEPYELAIMKYLVTDDRTFECQFIPINFFWGDCNDNSVSSVDGEILYIDNIIYDKDGNPIWIEDDDDLFPEDARIPHVGAPDLCLNPDPDKPSPERFLNFVNGGVKIICLEDIDARGDINLNEIMYEVADAVLFSNYFVYGLSVLDTNLEGQIAATDVNGDGVTLSVADLVYLIRLIVGDASPLPKLSPIAVDCSIDAGKLSVNAEMGAAYVVVKGEANPSLLASDMEMKYNYDGTNTKILIYSTEKDQTFVGNFLGIDGEVIEIEMATYDGAPVTTKLLPACFVLYQNRPNPFNPFTQIDFSLPRSSDVNLVVFNTTGQIVTTLLSKRMTAGHHTVTWDASEVATGVYFYRLTAGEFVETKKMLLLK